MFRHSVVMEFLTFCAFYALLKVFLLILNIEARRAKSKTLAGVVGVLA